MSHFSTIQTKIKDKDNLVEALELLGYWKNDEHQELSVYGAHAIDHPKVKADILVTEEIGFRLNEQTGTYELVTDLETWKESIPPKRFVEKVTQQYARMTIYNTVKDMGFEVAEEWEMDDNSIEITVNRWN